MAPHDKQPRGESIEWFTVRYRTIVLAGLALLLAAGAWVLFLRPRPAPPPPAQPEVQTGARFSSIEGSVQVKRAGTLEWLSASRATVLRQNDLVRTGPGGAAEIRFEDGFVFSVRPESLITVEESTQNTVSREQRVGLSIQSGEANFQTPARGVPGHATISTPTVRTTAERETAGNIQVAQSGETGLRIFRGKGEATTRTGQRIALASNQGVKVDAAGAAGARLSLPVVPQLTAPPHQTEVAYPDLAQAVTLLMWNGVPGASGYRVMVDYSPSFTRPLYDRHGQRATQMELRGLEAGTYYWKVAAVDTGGAEGGFSDLWRFSLTKAPAGPSPALLVDTLELKGNVLHARGRTDPGASLTLDGERLEVQSDGSFNEFLTVDAGTASVTLRSTGVRGGVAEQRRRVTIVN
ncbi:MAG TPA: FecR domain-containing protein [Vicinamibacteria bacterium]|nr:FecR domain-containing protein [Vicinamibacteria bacterium]